MENQIICGCYKVSKSDIVEAINNGADTVEKVGEVTKAGTGCGKCKSAIAEIIREVKGTAKEEDSDLVCGCYKITKEDIVNAVRSGADTVEKVGERTKAGTGCGKCKGTIENIIQEVVDEQVICGCYKVNKKQIVDAIKNGADTVEKVGEVTKAGTGCGACKGTIEEIIKEVNGDDSNLVCGCYKVSKKEIVEAIKNGADTVEKVGEVTRAGTGCGACKGTIEEIIKEVNGSLVCGCYKVTKEEIVDAVRSGADTVEKVGSRTKAGTGCGRCKGSIENIIQEVVDEQIICGCYKVNKRDIVNAIENGADTVEKVGDATKAGTGCGACKGTIEEIIKEVNGENSNLVCGCYKVTKEEIIDAVRSGADTVEKVGARTKAGTGCGKCKANIEKIIEEVKDAEIICGCYQVTKEEIIDAIKNGATTVEEVGKVTKAGTGCGGCKGTIQNIIDEEINNRVVCGCYNVIQKL